MELLDTGSNSESISSKMAPSSPGKPQYSTNCSSTDPHETLRPPSFARPFHAVTASLPSCGFVSSRYFDLTANSDIIDCRVISSECHLAYRQ